MLLATRRRVAHLGLLAVVTLVATAHNALVAQSTAVEGTAAHASVTFNRDIAPLLYQHCVSCHRPDGPAPFSLLTFDDVRKRASLVANVTRTRYMPPWKPEPGFGEFAGSRRLSDAHVALFSRWVAAGAPEGALVDRVAVPSFTPGWQLGQPDLIVALPEYTLPAEGLDVFRNFVVPIPVTARRYVRGVEFQAGAAAVHHANIRLDYSRASRQLDDADPGPGYEGLILHSADYPDGHFLGWTPGQFAPLAPKGLAWRLNPGADFVVQLHMRPTGKPESVAPRIGLYFTDDAPRLLPVMLRLGRQNLDIAAGDAGYLSRDWYILPVDARIEAVQPHSHYRARDVKAIAEVPDGATRPIIHIATWDFAWQDVYRVAEPFWLPAGTRISSEYLFDNSADNPRNPERPPKRAIWGFKSSDEMADVWIQVVTRTDADRERLLADFRMKMVAEDLVGVELQLTQTPNNLPLRNDAALLHLELGHTTEAIQHFAVVVQQSPDSAVAHYNLGTAIERTGAIAEPAMHYERAIALDPTYATAHVNLGTLRVRQGRLAEAVHEYEAALRTAPDDFAARNNLGRVLLSAGRPADAAPHLEAAVRLNPRHAEAQFNLAELYGMTGRATEAIAHHREALRLRPRWEPALIGLSWLLSSSADAGVRRPGEALQLAALANEITRQGNPLALDALAAAYARSGRFTEAVSAAADALALAQRGRAADLVMQIQHRVMLYRSRQPFTASPP